MVEETAHSPQAAVEICPDNGQQQQGGQSTSPARLTIRDFVRQFVEERRARNLTPDGEGESEQLADGSSIQKDSVTPVFFLRQRSNANSAENTPESINRTPKGVATQPVRCPNCKRTFNSARGLSLHTRRGGKGSCALRRREIINQCQNVATPLTLTFRLNKRIQEEADEDVNELGDRPRPAKRRRGSKAPTQSPPKPTPTELTGDRAKAGRQATPAATAGQHRPTTTNGEALLIDNWPERAQQQRNDPMTSRRPLRIPRLTAEAGAKLTRQLMELAQTTATKMVDSTWEEVEAAVEGFTTQLYDAIWFADKDPKEANQRGKRNKPSTNTEDSGIRKTRVSPRQAQAQENVDKALQALGAEERAQQGKQSGATLDDKLKKRALERNLRTARRRLIMILKEESAQNLQALYMKDRKKCVEQLLADEDQPRSQDCPIQLSELEAHFRDQHSEQLIDSTSDVAHEFLDPLASAPSGACAIDLYFTEEDVRAQLLKSNLKSAAGPDGIGFFVYKRFEEVLVPAMTVIYNACSRHRRIPEKWKESVTVLIPKQGDPNDVKSWRPINLQDCIYKLYAALWASRITDWASQSGVASKSQKGFMPVNGCHEHLFLAQSILNSTRRGSKPLYMTYYDLKNAFGSVPHKLIHVVLKAQRLPKHVREIIMDLYQGASFCVVTKEGCTGRIENRRGVKQGCPLSPILFNLAIEPLLQRLAACDAGLELRTTDGRPPVKVSHMAYADDLKTVASTRAGISTLHQVVVDFLQWTGLEANLSKCATLGWKRGENRQQPDPVQLNLHNEVLPVVKLGEAYKYLGAKDALESSVHQNQILRVMSKAKKDITKLVRSALLSWQKLDAIRTFVMSRLDYHLRHC